MTQTTATESKLETALALLDSEVRAIRTGEDWMRWMRYAAKFHEYSFGNMILIAMQCPDATRVAGYQAWRTKFDRQVKHGEKGITILAPIIHKYAKGHPKEGQTWLAGFRTVAVFDVSQTEGKPLPEDPRKVSLQDGEAPAGMWDALVRVVQSAGFSLVLKAMPKGVDGMTEFAHKRVTIDSNASEAQRCLTLAHELGHVRLHAPEDGQIFACRMTDEVEAESVAFLVASHFGMDSLKPSVGYVANWAKTPEDVQKVGQRVMRAAKWVIDVASDPV